MIIERLSKRSVRAYNGCLLWIGAKAKGYGVMSIDGQMKLTHRIAWEYVNGPISDGLHVLHLCDTPACIESSHLFLGTNSDNMADKVKKKRHTWGSTQPTAKLTEPQVVEIKNLLAVGSFSHREIGEQFGVSKTTITSISIGRTWTHVA